MQSPVFVFGAPRSGTTWLGKILDSHPDTLLRHEPDAIHATNEFPFAMASSQIEEFTPAAAAYLTQRTADRELRCAGSPPYFQKSYRGPVSAAAREALLASARALDRLCGGRLDRRLKIPDWTSGGDQVVPVVKSVDSASRVPLFAGGLPDKRFVYIVRHPCGVVGSKQRGERVGKMGRGKAFRQWLNFDLAQEMGLTEANLERWTALERNAWRWALTTDFVVRNARALPNVMILLYEQLCDTPMDTSKSVFAFCSLPWQTSTASYLDSCLAIDPGAQTGYYSVAKNPQAACNRWRQELDADEITQIKDICRHSAAWDLIAAAGFA